jgi:hypothetical protein
MNVGYMRWVGKPSLRTVAPDFKFWTYFNTIFVGGGAMPSDEYRVLFKQAGGFVAQIGLRPISPLPQTDLAYSHGTWYAKRCEAV